MSLIQETDFGTPRSKSETMVTLTIDGNTITVPEGTSIMRAAMELGTKIPKLCATDSVKSFGSCRLCLVEIEGRKGTPASCTTPAEAGMNPQLLKDAIDFAIVVGILGALYVGYATLLFLLSPYLKQSWKWFPAAMVILPFCGGMGFIGAAFPCVYAANAPSLANWITQLCGVATYALMFVWVVRDYCNWP